MDENQRSSSQLSDVVQPLLTDIHQVNMAYAYWKSSKFDYVVFDLFFRENPFKGEFTVFAGLEECLKFLQDFKYLESDIEYLKEVLPPTVEESFFDHLKHLNLNEVKVFAVPEGTVVFPRVPLMRVEGPLLVVQLLETTFLVLVSYASLVATNAARFRLAAGPNVQVVEFGLRRAQGPDGGMSASRYTYLGGFDGTSNVLAGKMHGIPVRGTHGHSFVMSYSSLNDCSLHTLKRKNDGSEVDFLELCKVYRGKLASLLMLSEEEANDGELASFTSYAISFPDDFLALVDTYDVLKSGLLNFCAVAMSLNEAGYKALGIRIDSGDLAFLSRSAHAVFCAIGETYKLTWFEHMIIVASNDINEKTILSLNDQGHRINCFGVGTHLVTCQKQSSLDSLFELVEGNSRPCIRLSSEVEKIPIPGRKCAYRLFGYGGDPLVDLLQMETEPPPRPGQRIMARHPFQESKRAYVHPMEVCDLLELCFSDGKICTDLPTLPEIRVRVKKSLAYLRSDMKRQLNPTPYKVSVSDQLYQSMHLFWLQNAPIGELM